jgi:hypothetical protein
VAQVPLATRAPKGEERGRRRRPRSLWSEKLSSKIVRGVLEGGVTGRGVNDAGREKVPALYSIVNQAHA